MPTWVAMSVYLVSVLHLSPLQLVLMGTAMEAAVFLSEMPTGVVADTYSRRLSLIVGYARMGAGVDARRAFSAPSARDRRSGRSGGSRTPSRAAPTRPGSRTRSASRGRVAVFLRAPGSATWARSSGSIRQVAARRTCRCARRCIAGGAVTIVLRPASAIVLMPETRLPPPAARGARLAARRAARRPPAPGARYARAAPVILLLVGAAPVHGHVERGVRPAQGSALPARRRAAGGRELRARSTWFGIFWLVGMVIGVRRDVGADPARRAPAAAHVS